MKITYNSLINSVNNSMQSNLRKLQDLQQKLSSGKKINAPSDDPIVAARLNIFKTQKSQYEQYINTIDYAQSWLERTENSVSQINGTMQALRDICIQAGSDALSEDGRHSLYLEAEQLYQKLLSDANGQHLGNYLFAGLKTTQAPFGVSEGTVSYAGDQGAMVRGISFESDMAINIDGARLFNMDHAVSEDPDVFAIIEDLMQALQDNNPEPVTGEILEQLDRASANILNIYSEIGARVNRLDMTRQQHENALLGLEKNISVNEDIDIAEVIMELRKAEMVYMTSLDVAGRIFPPSLLDYLR